MKYQELRDHIHGSHLMRHDLEAFLIQSAYIEGILKIYVDFHFFTETKGQSYDNKLLSAIKKNIEKYSLAELVDLLKKADLLTDQQKKQLDEYRQKRNKVLHHLLEQISSETFENDLITVYETGKQITDSNEFLRVEKMLDEIEIDKTIRIPKTNM